MCKQHRETALHVAGFEYTCSHTPPTRLLGMTSFADSAFTRTHAVFHKGVYLYSVIRQRHTVFGVRRCLGEEERGLKMIVTIKTLQQKTFKIEIDDTENVR